MGDQPDSPLTALTKQIEAEKAKQAAEDAEKTAQEEYAAKVRKAHEELAALRRGGPTATAGQTPAPAPPAALTTVTPGAVEGLAHTERPVISKKKPKADRSRVLRPEAVPSPLDGIFCALAEDECDDEHDDADRTLQSVKSFSVDEINDTLNVTMHNGDVRDVGTVPVAAGRTADAMLEVYDFPVISLFAFVKIMGKGGICTKTGMNLNQELAAQLTKSPAIGQPALSDVINGVKSKAGSTAVRSALVLALKYAFVLSANEGAQVEPVQVGFEGEFLGERKGSGGGSRRSKWVGLCPLLGASVEARLAHVGRIGGDIPRGTTEFPEITELDTKMIINAAWREMQRQVKEKHADAATQRAAALGEDAWKGTADGGSILEGRAAGYITNHWNRGQCAKLKRELIREINKPPTAAAETTAP